MAESSVLFNNARKKLHCTTKFALPECDCHRKHIHPVPEDRISKLPDEILILILSLLTTEEAVRASVLGWRWRYLWTFTNRLEFSFRKLVLSECDSSSHKLRLPRYKTSLSKLNRLRMSTYVDWVNQVLKLHKGTPLNEFTVGFVMNDAKKEFENFESDVYSWISFALEKRIKRLELEFTSVYDLTTQFLSNFRLDSLTSLVLCSVEVTGEVVEYILSHCPFLEVLKVSVSRSLVNLIVCGPSLNLKYLEICNCRCLKSIKIQASNLVSFKYDGHTITKIFLDAPRLVAASFDGAHGCFVVKNFGQFWSHLSQVETLELGLTSERFVCFPKFPQFSNLKELKLVLKTFDLTSLLFCSSLLMASPILQRFALKLFTLTSCEDLIEGEMDERQEQEDKHPYKCLKVVELVGFIGLKMELELAVHILKNAVSLEQIIIDSRSPIEFQRLLWKHAMQLEMETLARKHLEPRLPPGAKLVILSQVLE